MGKGPFHLPRMQLNCHLLLHILQTHLWYDGLAQDVPIWSSQYSVIVMLVLILFLMIPERGIFLGTKVRLPAPALGFIQRWHGLSWKFGRGRKAVPAEA